MTVSPSYILTLVVTSRREISGIFNVATVVPNGPAEKAGLRGPRVTQRGPLVYVDRSMADLIIAADNQPVKTADDFLTIVESKEPGQQVVLTIVREGRKLNIPLTLVASE